MKLKDEDLQLDLDLSVLTRDLNAETQDLLVTHKTMSWSQLWMKDPIVTRQEYYQSNCQIFTDMKIYTNN